MIVDACSRRFVYLSCVRVLRCAVLLLQWLIMKIEDPNIISPFKGTMNVET
jgi:hypothetical protein